MKKLFYLFTILSISLILVGCDAQDQMGQSNQNLVPTPNQTAQTEAQSSADKNADPAPSVFNKTLSIGSSGTVVDNLQQFLSDEGLYFGQDSGYFDQATENAVVLFEQQENILPANGIFGTAERVRANAIVADHPEWLTTVSNDNQYSNVNGSPVHSPAYSTNGPPAGASAKCGDGTYSFSMHRQGTCSHHGGVSKWY